jgi:hypothetical protein
LEHLIFHAIFKGFLAKFTLQGLPEEGLNFLALVYKALAVNPFLEARNVDDTHWASALAWTDETIGLTILTWGALFLGSKADTADYIIHSMLAAHDRAIMRAAEVFFIR